MWLLLIFQRLLERLRSVSHGWLHVRGARAAASSVEMHSAQELYDEWYQNPSRKVLLVDEARFDGGVVVQVHVCASARQVVNAVNKTQEFRETKLDRQKREVALHALNFYPDRYEQLRAILDEAIGDSELVMAFATNNRHLKAVRSEALGPAARLTDGTGVDGLELRFLQLTMKVAANHWRATEGEQVDVIVDRSAQLGIDHNQRGFDPHAAFQVYEVLASGLNYRSDGRPSAVQSPARFRIIGVGKTTRHFRDAVLIADAAAYMARPNLEQFVTKPDVAQQMDSQVAQLPPLRGSVFLSQCRASPSVGRR